MKLKKFAIILTACSIFIGNIFVACNNPTISKRVKIHVDFSTSTGEVFEQTCNAANIWDVSHVPSNMTEFKERNPSIDTLILMTATGGRSGGSNDYVYRYGNGTVYYNFTNLTTALDKVVSGGMKLELVIGNIPHALANKTSFEPEDYGAFDALTLPPGNMTEYYWYICNLTSTCLTRYGMGNVNTWEWRLMTEPDNKDWWTAGRDAYIDLWMNTTSAIKKFIPDASLVLGNMAWKEDLTFMKAVLQEVKALNASLLPDTVSFSYYHSLRSPEPMDHLENLILEWDAELDSLNLNKNITITCEEGFILHDEEGKRLWAGDGTELGAAWEAWMITSSAGKNFKRFAQWSLEADGYLSPRGYVHLMAGKMDGMDMVEVYVDQSINPVDSIDGIAVKNESSQKYYIMLYQYIPLRVPGMQMNIDLDISGLSLGDYTTSFYMIDKHNHNWFTTWLEDVQDIEDNATLINDVGSRYDLSVGSRFNHVDAWIFWWNWKQANPFPTRELVATATGDLNMVPAGRQSLDVRMNSNCVLLIEIA